MEAGLLTTMARNLLLQSQIKHLCSSHPRSNVTFLKLTSKRWQHTRAESRGVRGVMKAWQIRRYGGNEELTWSESVRVPRILHPDDILVSVNAASLNMLDIRMRGKRREKSSSIIGLNTKLG